MRGPAFWLPEDPDAPLVSVPLPGDGEATRIETVDWTPGMIRRICAELRSARRQHLANLPLPRIIELIDGVAGRFLDPTDPIRNQALDSMMEISRLSGPMAQRVLDGMASDWRTGPLETLLRSEFPDPAVLDRFVDDGSGHAIHAVAPEVCFHIFSGNVPGVAVMSLIRALLVRSASIAKTASGEPMLSVLFAEALAAADPALGKCLAVGYWKGGDEALEQAAMDSADVVIAYGSDRSIEAIRGRLPAGRRLVEYGTRLSIAIVLREALGEDAAASARAAAGAVATFDQQGCVSPHAILVEAAGETAPEQWAALLADAMAEVERRLPRGPVTEAEAAAIQQARARAEFAALGGDALQLYRPQGTEWTVIFGPGEIEASCLNRTIRVIPVDDAGSTVEMLEPFGSVLQSVGCAGSPERVGALAGSLARLGASRIVPLDRLAWPPPRWHHDGGQPLRDLVRWCDLE